MKRLSIINSDSKECTYGGVAPIMRNMHVYLSEAFDVKYYYIPDSWRWVPVPNRIKTVLFMLLHFAEIRKSDFILSHVPEASYVVSFMRVPFAHIFHGNTNAMLGSRYWFGKYFAWVFDLFEKRISRICPLQYTVGPVIRSRKKLYNPIKHDVAPVDVNSRSGFIFAGRLEEVKKIDRIIKMYASLPDTVKADNKLYIAGSGTLKDDLVDLVRSLGLEDNVVFLGSLSNENLVRMDAKCKILIMASREEGLPTAIAEALSVGVPVIATDVGDIGSVIKTGYNGFLFPVDFKYEDYHEAIDTILSNYKTFAENALASSQVFDAEAITKEMVKDINKLIL